MSPLGAFVLGVVVAPVVWYVAVINSYGIGLIFSDMRQRAEDREWRRLVALHGVEGALKERNKSPLDRRAEEDHGR